MPAGRVGAPVLGVTGEARGGAALRARSAEPQAEVRPREPRVARRERRQRRGRGGSGAAAGGAASAPLRPSARPRVRRHPEAGPARARRGGRSAARRRRGAGRGHRGRGGAGRGAGGAARAAAAGRDRGGAARGAACRRRSAEAERHRRPPRPCRSGRCGSRVAAARSPAVRFTLGAFERGDPLAGGSQRSQAGLAPGARARRRRRHACAGASRRRAARATCCPPSTPTRSPVKALARLGAGHLPLPRHGARATLEQASTGRSPSFTEGREHASRSTRGPAATSATTPARRSSASARTRRSTLVEIDIESDDALHRAYLERIPVVALDGEELFELLRRRGHAGGAGAPRMI